MELVVFHMDGRDEQIQYYYTDLASSDVAVYHVGMEKCKPGHSFGPALRDHYLIHYVLSGSGKFHVQGRSYELHENQGFLITPGVVTFYEASVEDPWTYAWVGFRGIKAASYLKMADLDIDNPVFSCEGAVLRKCFDDMMASSNYQHGFDLRLQGLIAVFLSELIENAGKAKISDDSYRERYIRRALQFIEANYSRDMTIKELAAFMGLNQNYFSSFFKEKLGIPPQEYLLRYRIQKACELLRNKALSINEIARSVGYSDPLGFSKIFRQRKGLSPRDYREK